MSNIQEDTPASAASVHSFATAPEAPSEAANGPSPSQPRRHHITSKQSVKYGLSCAVCGQRTYVKCGVCGVGLHDTNSKSDQGMKTCFIDYHDSCMFGLCRNDSPSVGKVKEQWTPPTDADVARHRANFIRIGSGGPTTRSAGTGGSTGSERRQRQRTS